MPDGLDYIIDRLDQSDLQLIEDGHRLALAQRIRDRHGLPLGPAAIVARELIDELGPQPKENE